MEKVLNNLSHTQYINKGFNPVRGEANVSKLRYPLLLYIDVAPYPFVSPSSLGQSGQKGVAEEQACGFEIGMVAEMGTE